MDNSLFEIMTEKSRSQVTVNTLTVFASLILLGAAITIIVLNITGHLQF